MAPGGAPSDALGLAAAIAAGHTGARAVMAATLEAVAASDPGAVARLLPEDDALRLADAATGGRGPFAGVPMLAKDLGAAARGLAPCAGAPALRARARDPEADSALFARFRAGGLIPVGLSTVPEFGMALTSEPPGAAPVRNPFDAGLSAGGSSGAAAAAVAAGLVAVAHATDAAGSIRVPAAACGLWGLKPSRGATPMGPEFSNLLMGLVGELVVARSLRDVDAAFELAAGRARGPFPDPADTPLPERPRIALMVPDRCGAPQREAARTVGRLLSETGCEVTEVPAPDALGLSAQALAGRILCVSLAEWLDGLGITEAEVTPFSAACAARGRAMSGREVFAMTRALAQLSHDAWALFDRADALLMPVLSGPPPRLGLFDAAETDPDARLARMEALAPNAALANAAGLPALVLPAGMADGLPVGVQLIGPMGADRALMTLAGRIAPALPPVPLPPLAGAVA